MLSLYPMSRTDNLVVQELKDEVLIYDLKINKALCLNHTSALVWNLCDGKKSITEIKQAVSQKLKAPVKDEIIWLALERLSEQNLLVSQINTQHIYQGMSRREVVKRIGIASAVSLPVVSAIIAPTAISAQSLGCVAPGYHGCPCESDANCRPGALCVSNICDCTCLESCDCQTCNCECVFYPPTCEQAPPCICPDPCNCPPGCPPQGTCVEAPCDCLGLCGCECDSDAPPCP
jgi:hypothetical protein